MKMKIILTIFHEMKIILKWFSKGKLKINSIVINQSDTVELLGITVDNIPTFNEHLNNLCCNASYKLYALCRIKKYLTRYLAKPL